MWGCDEGHFVPHYSVCALALTPDTTALNSRIISILNGHLIFVRPQWPFCLVAAGATPCPVRLNLSQRTAHPGKQGAYDMASPY